jgi:hypothetical protein
VQLEHISSILRLLDLFKFAFAGEDVEIVNLILGVRIEELESLNALLVLDDSDETFAAVRGHHPAIVVHAASFEFD